MTEEARILPKQPRGSDQISESHARYLSGMAFCICHISALEFWRSLDSSNRTRLLACVASRKMSALAPPFEKGARTGKVAIGVLEEALQDLSGGLSRPVHILVPSESYRLRSESVIAHAHSNSYPKKSFCKISEEWLVVVPELAFVQHACKASIVELLVVGAEITGSYAVERDSLDGDIEGCGCGFVHSEPLTSLKKIQSYVDRVSGEHGVKNARRALRYIPENCASPMEAVLAILLHAPRSLGGYGLPKPCMNYRIDMSGSAKWLSAKTYYVCDLYWPQAKLCVEYDSNMFHTGPDRIAADSARRTALAQKGITVVSVTGNQIANSVEMDRTALLLAKRLGIRPRVFSYDYRLKQREFRKELFASAGIASRR